MNEKVIKVVAFIMLIAIVLSVITGVVMYLI